MELVNQVVADLISALLKYEHPLAAVGDKYLLATFPGFGNKGDVVKVVRAMGELSVVSNGPKQFCIETINLSICPVHPPLVQQRSQ